MATDKHSSNKKTTVVMIGTMPFYNMSTTKEKKFGQIKIKETRTGWCSSY